MSSVTSFPALIAIRRWLMHSLPPVSRHCHPSRLHFSLNPGVPGSLVPGTPLSSSPVFPDIRLISDCLLFSVPDDGKYQDRLELTFTQALFLHVDGLELNAALLSDKCFPAAVLTLPLCARMRIDRVLYGSEYRSAPGSCIILYY